MTNKDEAPPQELFFRISGTGEGNWEINRPQPAIIKLVEQGIFHGEVLDIGCGIGDNAIYIASHTNDVNITAIDLVNSL
jgi:2-polyprenyl-3-methyl-5-hydroxy-6-metoxy-1,4-benzoquinol methylase